MKVFRKLLLRLDGWATEDFENPTKSVILYLLCFLVPEAIVRKCLALPALSLGEFLSSSMYLTTLYLPLIIYLIVDTVLVIFVAISIRIEKKKVKLRECIPIVAYARIPTFLVNLLYALSNSVIFSILGFIYSFLILFVGIRVLGDLETGRAVRTVTILLVVFAFLSLIISITLSAHWPISSES